MAEYMDIEQRIASALEKISQAQRSLIWEVSTREKLSPIQIQFLIHLDRFPAEQRTVSALAREFDLAKPTVSDALVPLEEKGLIARKTNEEDRRSATLALTAKGKKKLAALGDWRRALVDAVSGFSAGEKESALKFLSGVIGRLFDEGVVSVARMCTACEHYRPGDERHRCALTGRGFGDAGINVGCASYRAPAGDKRNE
jgi:DNA-binding MarR family transcriptional regulator